jgi:hypothetical protein
VVGKRHASAFRFDGAAGLARLPLHIWSREPSLAKSRTKHGHRCFRGGIRWGWSHPVGQKSRKNGLSVGVTPCEFCRISRDKRGFSHQLMIAITLADLSTYNCHVSSNFPLVCRHRSRETAAIVSRREQGGITMVTSPTERGLTDGNQALSKIQFHA